MSDKLLIAMNRKVPATGVGLFRVLYGLVTLQEIIFLLYFNHLIFDPIPYIDVEFPTIPFFLGLWIIVVFCLIIGYRYQWAVVGNYLFWIVFVNFTPMQRDFDGGFDMFMTGAGFFLLFMPGDRAFSVDSLRYKLSRPFVHYSGYDKPTVSILVYTIPVAICLGFLYLDSAIHKLFAEHWRNGLGSWLPSTQPYYVSALDVSFLLNQEWLQKIIGYTILVFQFTFVFLFTRRRLQIVFLMVGIGLHLGITLSLNIYPFGLGMLVFYILLVPFLWWRNMAYRFRARKPSLTVFYDKLCPLCNRTVLVLNHFDVFNAIDFLNAQDHASNFSALQALDQETILHDLYALDGDNRVFHGVDTYIRIFIQMRYLAPLGWFLSLPLIRHYASRKYRTIADTRRRVECTAECMPVKAIEDNTFYHCLFEIAAVHKPRAFARKLTKILVAILLLQLNSTVHYGIVYRLKIDTYRNVFASTLTKGSNALISVSQIFLGIAPHALYLHDHFSGYDRIVGITYQQGSGLEQWLPFINSQGRMLAPNWGRVHSMWANIAVTPKINDTRLKKFIMKVTAFWGKEIGLNLDDTIFHIKIKQIDAPNHWVYDLRHKNLANPWHEIGTVQWSGDNIAFNLPGHIDRP